MLFFPKHSSNVETFLYHIICFIKCCLAQMNKKNLIISDYQNKSGLHQVYCFFVVKVWDKLIFFLYQNQNKGRRPLNRSSKSAHTLLRNWRYKNVNKYIISWLKIQIPNFNIQFMISLKYLLNKLSYFCENLNKFNI